MEQVVKHDEATLNRIFQQLLPILRRLLNAKRNFRVTINVNIGQKFKIEAVEYFDEV
jgi:hypothetical protein